MLLSEPPLLVSWIQFYLVFIFNPFHSSIDVRDLAFALNLIILELPQVTSSILKNKQAHSLTFVFSKVAFVDLAILILHLSLTFHRPILKVTCVNVPIRVAEGALPVWHVVGPVTLVRRAIVKLSDSKAFLYFYDLIAVL